MSDILEAWQTNNRINLRILEHVSDDGLKCTLSTRGGRDVARQFAHIHDNRIYHLEKRTPDLADDLDKFQSKGKKTVTPSRAQLKKALTASGEAVGVMLEKIEAGEKGYKGFKKGVYTTLSYLIAHESHHRGSILLTLKQCGESIDKDARYSIWDWDRI